MKKNALTACVALLVALSFAVAPVLAADKPAPAPKPYPLNTCIVSDEKLGMEGEKPVVLVHDGQEFKFCCKKCIGDFNKDPKKFHDKLAAELAKKKSEKHDDKGHEGHGEKHAPKKG